MIMNNEAQDELDYQELIAKVATINKDAAVYMMYAMRKISGFCTSGDLWDVVIWKDTLQGHDFWYDIACKLEE
jgi:hypothetical protein